MSIEIKNLSCVYGVRTPYEKKALDNISFTVNEGESVGLIGMTGSGKSTLLQHLNGLIKLKSGSVKVFDIDLTKRRPDLMKLRKHVGMLFQYPEYQLFEETVAKDIAFGPKNQGLSADKIAERVRYAMDCVHLNYEKYAERSPFELSGGQMRRAAIAGVIAMRPRVLVLDEPIAGLDPKGKHEILALVKKLKNTFSPTVIVVSHDMDSVAENCDKVALFADGEIARFASPRDVFYDDELLARTELDCPSVVKVVKELERLGMPLSSRPVTKAELIAALTEGGTYE